MKEMKEKNHGKGSILIVEDEGIISLDIRNLLVELGYKVAGVALSGKEALAMAKKTKPDLVLMDIVLNGPMDGIEAAARIKLLGIPSIFLTSYVDEQRVERAKLVQPFGYILKPFRNEELRAAIEMALFRLSSEKVMDIQDIERTRLELVLASSEAKFRLVFEEAIDGILIADIKTKRFVMANSALCRLLGYRESEILKLGIHDIHPKKNLPHLLDKFMELAIGKTKLVEGVPCLKKNGSVVYVDIAASTLRFNNRPCLVGFFRDVTERRGAEEEILRLKKFNERIVQNSPTGIVTTDIDGTITSANPAVLKLLGSPSEQKTKQFNVLTLDPLVKQGISTFFKNCLTRGKTIQAYGIPYKSFWGKLSFISMKVVPLTDEAGKQIGSIALIEDVTERKQDEIKIQEGEERFKAAFQNAPAGMALVNPDEHFQLVNPQLCSILGYSESELLKLKYTDLIHPEEIALSKKRIHKMVEGHIQVMGAEKRFIHKNGSTIWGIVNAYSVRGLNPRPDYAVLHVLDITDRKRAENELLLKNALLDAQKEASIEGILAVDTDGKIISHNARFEDMWRIPKGVVQTGDDQKLLHFVSSQLKKPKAFLSMVNRLYANPTKRSQDLLEFVDGRVLSRYTSPLSDSKGNTLGRIWFFRDITHEIEVDRAKSEFISTASHELRTPLSGVKWLLEAVLRRGHLTTQQAEFIRKALESNERIINLANDLLDVTLLESGSITPAPNKIDLAVLLKQLIEEMQPFLVAKQQTIRFTPPSKAVIASLDRKLVFQTISNVLINAIKYSGEHKAIEVILAPKANGFKIQINDQGPGFSKSDQKRIFERFFRGKAAVHRSVQGFGLGLYLAQKFAYLCGGTIDIKSQLGMGTNVTISFPPSLPPKKS